MSKPANVLKDIVRNLVMYKLEKNMSDYWDFILELRDDPRVKKGFIQQEQISRHLITPLTCERLERKVDVALPDCRSAAALLHKGSKLIRSD